MDYVRHMLFAGVLFLLAYFFAQQFFGEFFSGWLLCLFGAVLPDIDHKESRISKAVFAISLGLLYAALCLLFAPLVAQNAQMGLLVGVLLSPPVFLTALFALVRPKHRGITHSLFFMLVCCGALAAVLSVGAAGSFALGFFSHLISDRHLKFT